MFAVRCPGLLLQILRCAQKDIPCHHRRSRSCVILNEAADGVKDLEHLICSPHWQPPVMSGASCHIAPSVFAFPFPFHYSASRSLLFYAPCPPLHTSPEICTGTMPLKAYIKKRVSKSVDFKTRLLSSTGISPAVPYLITARPVPGHPGHSEAPAEVPADQPAARPERPWPYPRKRHARRC